MNFFMLLFYNVLPAGILDWSGTWCWTFWISLAYVYPTCLEFGLGNDD
jgi:hypothetical protein